MRALTDQGVPMTEPVNAQPEDHSFIIEREKLELEREKLDFEKQKFNVERSKLRWNWSVIVTILAALATVAAATITARFGIESQNEQAKSQFEIKAAEIVLQTRSPEEASDKAKALKSLFPNRLPENFAESFDPTKLASYSPDIISEKLELLKLLEGKKAPEMKRIVELWTILYPEDQAGFNILENLKASSPSQP
jgi:hypothetical protein